MKKIFTGAFSVLILLVLTTGTVFAQDPTPLTGTVTTIETQLYPATGETIVVVTLVDSTGTEQTVYLSLESAEMLGLVTTDPLTGEATVNDDALETEVTIDPGSILPPPADEEEEEDQHPVGSALGEFFTDLVGVDYDTVMESHDDGFGFGVIAQALWLTNQVEGDADTFTSLLEAKRSGDYSGITLADGSTPDNWGDVVKSLKKGDNLGSVMSGRANSENGDDSTTVQSETGIGNGNGNGNGQGNSGIHGNNGNNGNSGNGNSENNKGEDKGNNKDKDKNKP